MAIPYFDYGSVLLNLEYQLEAVPDLIVIKGIIEAYRLANSAFMEIELTQDAVNDTLKKLTGCVVATGTDLNCYPTGYNTAILFDLNGDPVT